MVQEIGETTQEMMKADDQAVQDILNKHPSGSYYIVIHHKPTRMTMKGTGEQVLMRVVKKYDKKPINLLGTIILTVKDGDIIDTKVNLHDMPVDWEAVEDKAGLITNPYVQERPDIGGAYLYNV